MFLTLFGNLDAFLNVFITEDGLSFQIDLCVILCFYFQHFKYHSLNIL